MRLLNQFVALVNVFISFINLLVTFANLFSHPAAEDRAEELHEARLENLTVRTLREWARLKDDRERSIERGARVELLGLKIQREQWNHSQLGISSQEFTAEDYPEPGDVRRGILPPKE